MLKLNSQHARTYFQDHPTTTSPSQPTSHPTSRQTLPASTSYRDQRKRNYDEPEPQIISARPRAPLRTEQQFSECNPWEKENIIQNRYPPRRSSINSGLHNEKDAIMTTRNRNQYSRQPQVVKKQDYPFEMSQNNDLRLNQSTDLRLSQKMGSKQYCGRHMKRNEQIKSRISRDWGADYDELDAPYPPQQHRGGPEPWEKNQPQKGHPYKDFDRVDSHQYEGQLDHGRGASYQRSEKDTFSRRQSRNGETYRVSNYDMQPFENTPKKEVRSPSFGSAQRKQTLIQKSQLLQQKLKKISHQQTQSSQFNQPSPTSSTFEDRRSTSRQSTRPKNYESYSSVCPERSTKQRPFIANQSSGRVYTPRDSQVRRQRSVVRQRPTATNEKVGTLEEQTRGTGSTLDKISQLNEKINQRIQSIIQNYAGK